jgi:hypothetical protein
MRRLVLAIALLAGCKGMGSLGSGLGHIASGVGHVAGAVSHVAAPVANGFAKAAAPVARGFAKAAPVVGKTALYAAETVAEATAVGPVYVAPDENEPYAPDETTDLCLDCPDIGNCASCEAPQPSQ